MKLTIKTFQNLTFKVDIELDKTVKDLKSVIEKEQGKDYPCNSQKLIYNGKILLDDSKLTEYEFDEKKFIVLMITRPPPAPKSASTTTEQSSSATKKEVEDKSKQTTSKPDNKTSASATPASATTTSSSSSTSTSASTAAASTNTTTPARSNTDLQNPLQSLAGMQGAAAALAEMSGLNMGEPQISARLASLMSQPHFRQMQELIQQSPHLLSSTIESLAASDPEMYQFISENPDIFVSALNHPPIPGLRSSDSTAASLQRQVTGGGGMSQQGGGGLGILGQQPVVEQLLGNVTEHDKEAIERLKELGFSEYLAVQAYMACDKDEQLAANLLFQMDQ